MVGLNEWDTLKCYGNIARRTLEENFRDKTPKDWFDKKAVMAHALNAIINESTAIEDVAEEYHISKSRLQSLQSNAGTFAKMAALFCNKLKWKEHKSYFAELERKCLPDKQPDKKRPRKRERESEDGEASTSPSMKRNDTRPETARNLAPGMFLFNDGLLYCGISVF